MLWFMTRLHVKLVSQLISCARWYCLLLFVVPSSAQTVIGSARLLCGAGHGWETSGPVVGAIVNQTNSVITDLEIELSIITRDKKGVLKRQRDTRFVVVPSVNQNGIVTKLEPKGDVYFSIPGRDRGLVHGLESSDRTCGDVGANEVLNAAAIAITRINGRSLLVTRSGATPLTQAPLESMLQVPRYTPERVPTQHEVIQKIKEENALLQSTIINRQLSDCLSRGTWACSFNNDTNINVVITEQ